MALNGKINVPPLLLVGFFILLLGGQTASWAGDEVDTATGGSKSMDRQAVGAEPKRPRPGDKLGYSKEESTRRLDPEIRQFLDVFLRIYREPGLFTDRRSALALLGVDQFERRWHSRSNQMPDNEPTHFEDRLATQGIFARKGWQGYYKYGGWRDKGAAWYASLGAKIDTKIECIDSRAVEGYLDLFLQTGIDQRVPPAPRELWNRHGNYGTPYASAIGPLTPLLGMSFTKGCLTDIAVYGAFNFKEIRDDNVLN